MSKALPSNFDTVKLAAPPWSKGSSVRYMGDYELLEEIAQGGMGVVWKAKQHALDRIVAVKMIRGGALAGADDVQRFHAEAQAAANLKHPNIVSIHEVGEHEGQHYYSMDFIEGKTLADICHGKPMNAREAAELLRTVCDAVHFAHQRGVLHRDLKPHNLMLDAEGKPHVLDFGLAKRLDDDQSLTMSGAVLGSPSYMAPEQAQGRNDRVGPHTDVYALGAILYQMLTGRAPFLANTAAETMMQVVQREPGAPSKSNHDIPRDLETICLKCLEKEPARRYATARELCDELGRFLKGEPIHAQPASVARKAVMWLRQHPGWLAGAAALFVFGLLCAVFFLYQENAFMHAQQSNPALKREVGPLTKSLVRLSSMGTMVYLTLGLWINLWFTKHARRTTWRGVFDQTKHRATLPVPPYVRAIQIVAGFLCAGYGFLLIGKVIEVRVWEGGDPLPNHPGAALGSHLMVAFSIVWVGFWMLLVAWRDYVRATKGTPGRKIDDATREAVSAAVAQGDFFGAARIYRRAVPEAGAVEAREFAARFTEELRVNNPAGYKAAFEKPWWEVNPRPMLFVAVIEITVAVFLSFSLAALSQGEPLKIAWYLLGGMAYGIIAVIVMRLRGFLTKFLAFFVCMLTVMAGGLLFFDKPPAGHLLLLMIGIIGGIVLMRAGYKARPR